MTTHIVIWLPPPPHPSCSCPCCAEGPLVRWEAWCVQYWFPRPRRCLLRLLVICQSLWARGTETLRQYHRKVGILYQKSVMIIPRIGQNFGVKFSLIFITVVWLSLHYLIVRWTAEEQLLWVNGLIEEAALSSLSLSLGCFPRERWSSRDFPSWHWHSHNSWLLCRW